MPCHACNYFLEAGGVADLWPTCLTHLSARGSTADLMLYPGEQRTHACVKLQYRCIGSVGGPALHLNHTITRQASDDYYDDDDNATYETAIKNPWTCSIALLDFFARLKPTPTALSIH
jgi:hypothetical protein